MKLFSVMFALFTLASTAQAEIVLSCRSHVQSHDGLGLVLSDDHRTGTVEFLDENQKTTQVKLLDQQPMISDLAPMKNWSVYAISGSKLQIAIKNSFFAIPSQNVARLAQSGDWRESFYIENGDITEMYGELYCTRLK